MTSAPAIGFEYRPSRTLPRWLLGAAVLALLGVALCALAWWLKLALLAAVLLGTWRALRAIAGSPVSAAGWAADDSWTVHLRSQQDLPATLVSFRVLGSLVLLRLRLPGRVTQVLLLLPDNSDADIRRRLRMRLAARSTEPARP